MIEEAEALLHSSRSMNKLLKACLALFLLVAVSCIEFACLAAVIGTLTTVEFFFAIMFENVSLLSAMILVGIYTDLPQQPVQILASMPTLFMIFFSTTFSPGAGVNGLKELRYLFSRFYLWCMLPEDMGMEGCPESNTLLYLILASLLVPFLFVLYKVGTQLYKRLHNEKEQSSRLESIKTLQFAELQLELFGEKALKNLKQIGSSVGTDELEKIASRLKETKRRSLTEKKILSYINSDTDSEKVILGKIRQVPE